MISHARRRVQRGIDFDDGQFDGALSADGQVLATYLHGLFDDPAACQALLGWAGAAPAPASGVGKLSVAFVTVVTFMRWRRDYH